MSRWVRENAWHVLSTVAMLLVLGGQWQERQAGAAAKAEDHSTRISKLEELAAQERARLDGIYLRRDLSDEQLHAIASTIAAIEKRLERIEGRLR